MNLTKNWKALVDDPLLQDAMSLFEEENANLSLLGLSL
jgi:hypothetical protein